MDDGVDVAYRQWLDTGVISRAIETRGMFDMASSREGFEAGLRAGQPMPGTHIGRRHTLRAEQWVKDQGLTLEQLRAPGRNPDLVHVRRQLALHLRDQGWSPGQIGRLVGRDRTSVLNLLRPKKK